MHTQYLFVYQSTHGQILKSLAKFFPYFQTVFFESALAGVLETVYLVDESALVVSSQHMDEAGVPQFVGEQKSNDLYVILIPVDIVALKEILFVRRWTDLVEKTYEILQLPMNISGDDYWCLHFDNYRFFFKLRYYQV